MEIRDDLNIVFEFQEIEKNDLMSFELLNVEWFNSDNTRIVIIPGGTKTTIKSIFNSYVFSPHINHACILVLDNIIRLFGHIY